MKDFRYSGGGLNAPREAQALARQKNSAERLARGRIAVNEKHDADLQLLYEDLSPVQQEKFKPALDYALALLHAQRMNIAKKHL